MVTDCLTAGFISEATNLSPILGHMVKKKFSSELNSSV
jgi:hypothetical protein